MVRPCTGVARAWRNCCKTSSANWNGQPGALLRRTAVASKLGRYAAITAPQSTMTQAV